MSNEERKKGRIDFGGYGYVLKDGALIKINILDVSISGMKVSDQEVFTVGEEISIMPTIFNDPGKDFEFKFHVIRRASVDGFCGLKVSDKSLTDYIKIISVFNKHGGAMGESRQEILSLIGADILSIDRTGPIRIHMLASSFR